MTKKAEKPHHLGSHITTKRIFYYISPPWSRVGLFSEWAFFTHLNNLNNCFLMMCIAILVFVVLKPLELLIRAFPISSFRTYTWWWKVNNHSHELVFFFVYQHLFFSPHNRFTWWIGKGISSKGCTWIRSMVALCGGCNLWTCECYVIHMLFIRLQRWIFVSERAFFAHFLLCIIAEYFYEVCRIFTSP